MEFLTDVLNIVLTLVGFGLLIFFHELGHYWMAKKTGMKVETFSIGIGRPIYSWKIGRESWQIGWLPFGGYVRIKGQETSGKKYDRSKGSFFSATLWQRAQVVIMGPLANFILALVLFSCLWALGGRQKLFNELSSVVGWVDPKSALYEQGFRPGDQITAYDGSSYQGIKDHLFAPMLANRSVKVEGFFIDYENNHRKSFAKEVPVYPMEFNEELRTIGVQSSSGYLIFDSPVNEMSPFYEGALQKGDRLLWAEGHRVFSQKTLAELINSGQSLVSIERGGKHLLRRVPRAPSYEFYLEDDYRQELVDWQYETGLGGSFELLKLLPYEVDSEAVVRSRLNFIESELEQKNFPEHLYSELEGPLEVGDKIVAIDGHPVDSGLEVFKRIQRKEVSLIVKRAESAKSFDTLEEAQNQFKKDFKSPSFLSLTHEVGKGPLPKQEGPYVLLPPVRPIKRGILTPQVFQDTRQKLMTLSDTSEREIQLKALKKEEESLMLGVALTDRKVKYNPNPIHVFIEGVKEPYRVLTALVSGNLSPKFLSGPVGIAQVIYKSWGDSLREALYWLGVISLNLAFINLLPLPVLDGGHLVFIAIEAIRKKPLSPQTMERCLYPFAFLLIAFFIFVTYWDLHRLSQWLSMYFDK